MIWGTGIFFSFDLSALGSIYTVLSTKALAVLMGLCQSVVTCAVLTGLFSSLVFCLF